MEIYGWVYFDESQRAESAKKTLEVEGYRVEEQPQEDDAVVLLAIPPEPPPRPEALTARLRSLAEDFCVEFTGYGGGHQIVLRGHS